MSAEVAHVRREVPLESDQELLLISLPNVEGDKAAGDHSGITADHLFVQILDSKDGSELLARVASIMVQADDPR